MSSVGSSDSSNNANNRNDESVRRTREREEAKRTENELVKKQSRELRRVNEMHSEQMEKMKADHQAQMDQLRQRALGDINERDHKYHQEMEEMREVYRKQLQGNAEEGQRREETLRKATSSDLNNYKAKNETQKELLQKNFQKGLEERNENYSGAMEETREAQSQAIQKNRDSITRHYETLTNSMKENHNKKLSDLRGEYDDYRHNSEATRRDQDLQHRKQLGRSSDSLMHAVQKERMNNQENLEMMQDGFKDAHAIEVERFDKAARKNQEAGELVRDSMKSSVMDRVDNQVRRLEQDKENLKDANVRTRVRTEFDKKREVSNVAQAYQKNVDAYKNERDEAIRQGREGNQKDIEKIQDQNSKLMVDGNRLHRQKQEEMSRIHRTAYENLKTDFEVRNEQTQNFANDRVKHVYETTMEDKQKLIKLQLDNHAASQASKQDEIRNLREVMEDDKVSSLNRLRDRVLRQEVQHSERLNQVTSKYEKQIAMMKEQMVKDKRANEENLRRVTEEMQRAHKVAMDQVTSQTKDQLRQTNNQHRDEVRHMNKLNDEKLDQLMNELKRS